MRYNVDMRLLRVLLIVVISFVGTCLLSHDVSADTSCQVDDSSYSATAEVDAARYTVYARFSKQTQQGSATVTAASTSGLCLLSGSATLKGSTWAPIGAMRSTGGNIVFNLGSPQLSNLPDANRPELMLVSADNPPCTVDTECRSLIDGQNATIQAPDIALAHGALHIFIPKPLDSLTVSIVHYYADGTLMYSAAFLDQFDARMIPYYASHTSRVIVYKDGQQATITDTLPSVHPDGPWQFVYRLWRQHEGIITTFLIILSILCIFQLAKLIIYLIYRERRWRYAHGFLKDRLAALTTARARRIATIKYVAQRSFLILERVLLFSLITGIVVFGVSTFIIQFTRIDGESMSPTLTNTQLVTVNMIPTSISHLNKSNYTPQRGELIAAHPLFGTAVSNKISDELIVKRVIALPGERVTVKDSTIAVYNTAHPDGFNPDTQNTRDYVVTNDSSIQIDLDITLGNDEIFVCGDNRPVSIDSRDNGALSVSQVVGIVQGLPFGIQ